MSSYVLVSGALSRAPERRQSKSGHGFFVTATLVEQVSSSAGGDDERRRYWSLITFAELAKATLLDCREGDAVAVTGRFDLREYEAKDGTRKQSLGVTVEQALALKAQRELGLPQGKASPSPGVPFDDPMPSNL